MRSGSLALFVLALLAPGPAGAVAFEVEFRARVVLSDLLILPVGVETPGTIVVRETAQSPLTDALEVLDGEITLSTLSLTLEQALISDVANAWSLVQIFQCGPPCIVGGANGFSFEVTLRPGQGTGVPPASPDLAFGRIFFFDSLGTLGRADLAFTVTSVVPEPTRPLLALLGGLLLMRASSIRSWRA